MKSAQPVSPREISFLLQPLLSLLLPIRPTPHLWESHAIHWASHILSTLLDQPCFLPALWPMSFSLAAEPGAPPLGSLLTLCPNQMSLIYVPEVSSVRVALEGH